MRGSPFSPIVGPTGSLGYWQRPAPTNSTTTAAALSSTATRSCTFTAINPDGSTNATQVYVDAACPRFLDEDDEGNEDDFDVNFDDEDEDEDSELSDDAVIAIVCGSIAGAACLVATCLYISHRKKRRRCWEQVRSPESGASAGPAASVTAGRPPAPLPMASASEPVFSARSSTDKPALPQ
ncbi:hypothetical protein GGF31_008072 [Allomyces arbusculus]|nr:hypothetical protein GGF31_008072 [Allomyces arbusculus]